MTDQAQPAKKIVHYVGTPCWHPFIEGRMLLVPIDHPDTIAVENGEEAVTSLVHDYDPATGVIETAHTTYRRASEEQERAFWREQPVR